MKKHVNVFCSFALLMAYVTAMAALFTIFSLVERMENSSPGLELWLPCLTLCHLGLGLFLRRERSLRAVIYFCAAFYMLQAVLVFAVYGFFSSFVGVLVAMAMWLFSYYCCCEFNIKSLEAEKITKGFDLCCFALILLLFYCSLKALPIKTVLPLAVSALLCLFALIIVRGGQQPKLRSLAISAVLVLFFAAVAAGFVALASGGVKRLVEFFVGAVKAVALFVLRAIDALFRFLASLFPQKDYEVEMLPPELTAGVGEIGDMSFELIDPQLIMIVSLLVGLLIALAYVVYRLIKGKHSVVMNFGGSEKGLSRKRSSIIAAILQSLSKLMLKLKFAYKCFALRNTAPGLFLQIEKRSRAMLHGRSESESCREFLSRAVVVYPHARAELEALADAMDAIHFGGGGGLSAAEITKIRRAVFKTVE